MIVPDDHRAEPAVRRIEIFTGAGHRREWPAEVKARIVAETLIAGETVSGVARRHGLRVDQLFAWRKQARRAAEGRDEGMTFVPAVAEARPRSGDRAFDGRPPEGLIEVDVSAQVVRIGRGAEAKAISAVIRALKARR